METKKTTIWTHNFICAMLANFMLCIAHSSANTLVSTYARFLDAGPVLMGMLTGLFFGVALLMHPVSGPIMASIDARKLLIIAFSVGALVNVGYALFQNIVIFTILRIINGIQYAFVGASGMMVAGDSLPPEKLGSGLGVYGMSGAIATSVGPTLGVVARDWGTRIGGEGMGFTFLFSFAALCLFIAVIPSFLLDYSKSAESLGAGPWYKNIFALAALPATITTTLVVVANSLFNAYMVPFAEEAGISGISVFFTVLAIAMLVSRPVSGKINDKYGAAAVIIPSLICFALSFVVIWLSHNLITTFVAAVLAAIGYGGSQPALQAMCLKSCPGKKAVASNTLYTGMDLGYFTGPLLGGVVISVSNYRTMFLTGAVPCVLALLCMFVIIAIAAKRKQEL